MNKSKVNTWITAMFIIIVAFILFVVQLGVNATSSWDLELKNASTDSVLNSDK